MLSTGKPSTLTNSASVKKLLIHIIEKGENCDGYRAVQIDKRTYCAKAQGVGNADVFLGRGYEQYNFTDKHSKQKSHKRRNKYCGKYAYVKRRISKAVYRIYRLLQKFNAVPTAEG